MPQIPHGVMFHRFHEEDSLPVGQGSLTPTAFEETLHIVGIENILSPEEWLFKLKRNSLKDKEVCLTFDDGLKCQRDVLPILERFGLKGFWFIYSSVFEGKWVKSEIYQFFAARYFRNIDEFYELFFHRCEDTVLKKLETDRFKKFVKEMSLAFPFYSTNDLKFRFIRNEILQKETFEKILDGMMEERDVQIAEISKQLWLSNQELKGLSDRGHTIGLHSYDHPTNFASLSYEDQLNQYRMNKEHIQKICNRDVVAMAHPLNSYHQETLKVLKELGIVCGFRSNMAPPNGKKLNPNGLEIAREDPANILGISKKNPHLVTAKEEK